MSKETIPLVSVIIPMYNSARFIPQTLESLLYQTMQDFEVIVVDDCSTDNSVEVVEGFTNRFGGVRLNVIKLPKNSGTPSLPRNVGIQIARGKYIAFLDSDDLFTKTALEELTTLAEDYQAELVHMEDFFKLWGGQKKSVDDPAFTDMNELTNPANFSFARKSKFRPSKPTFETANLAERVQKLLNRGYSVFPYMTFYRRDFLLTNQIKFPKIRVSEDQSFAFHAMCLAKKLLRVPNMNYIYRPRADSVTHEELYLDKHFRKIMRVIIDGFKELTEIMDGIIFFNEHADYRYAIMEWFFNDKYQWFQNYYAQIPPQTIYPLIKQEFSSDEAGFVAYIFNTANIQRLQIMQLQFENNELKNFYRQRGIL